MIDILRLRCLQYSRLGMSQNRVNLTSRGDSRRRRASSRRFSMEIRRLSTMSPLPLPFSTQPELGTVGLTEEEAAKRGGIQIYAAKFKPLSSALSGKEERALMKLVVDSASKRVLGVHIVGESAAEMIQLAAVAVRMGATKEDFDRTVCRASDRGGRTCHIPRPGSGNLKSGAEIATI